MVALEKTMDRIRLKRILKVILKGLKDLSKPDLILLRDLLRRCSKLHERIDAVKSFISFREPSDDLMTLGSFAIKQVLIGIDKELKSR